MALLSQLNIDQRYLDLISLDSTSGYSSFDKAVESIKVHEGTGLERLSRPNPYPVSLRLWHSTGELSVIQVDRGMETTKSIPSDASMFSCNPSTLIVTIDMGKYDEVLGFYSDDEFWRFLASVTFCFSSRSDSSGRIEIDYTDEYYYTPDDTIFHQDRYDSAGGIIIADYSKSFRQTGRNEFDKFTITGIAPTNPSIMLFTGSSTGQTMNMYMKDSFVHLYISRAKNMTIMIQQDTGYTSMTFFENTDYESCLQIFDRIVNGEEAGKHELHEDENEIISTLRSFLIDNPDIINDKRRIKAAIKDLFYDRGKLGNLLSLLIDYDIIHDIRTHAPVDEMFITRFENRLALDYGIERSMTRNAARIWVQAIVRC